MNEVTDHSPQALQAVKLLAQYLGKKLPTVWRPCCLVPPCRPQPMQYFTTIHAMLTVVQDDVLQTLTEWVADPTCSGNAMTLTVAGIIFANEEKYVEALKACHTGLTLEMCAPTCMVSDTA